MPPLYRCGVGGGPVLRAALLARLPELGTLNSKEGAALIGVAPFNLTAGRCAAGARLAAGAPRSGACCGRDHAPLAADAERHHQDEDAVETAMPGLNSRTRGLPTSPQAGRFNRSQSLWALWATPQPLPEELTLMTVAPRMICGCRLRSARIRCLSASRVRGSRRIA